MAERIEDLISKEVITQFQQLREQTTLTAESFERLIRLNADLNQSFGRAKTYKEAADGAKNIQQAENDLIATRERLNKLSKDQAQVDVLMARAKKLNAEASLADAKAEDIKTRAIERQTAAAERRNAAESKRKRPMTPEEIDAIPFTTNLDALEEERKRAEEMAAAFAKADQTIGQASENAIQYADNVSKAAKEISKVASGGPGTDKVDALIANRIDLDNLKKAQKELTADFNAGKITLDQYKASMKQLVVEETDLKLIISDLNKEITTQAKIDFSTPESIENLRAQNLQLTKLRDSLQTTGGDEAAKQIAELNAQIDRNNDLIDANSDKLAKQKINIGNYPTAFKGAFSVLNGELELVSKNLQSGGFQGKELEQLTRKQEALQNATALVSKEFSTTTAQQNAYKEAARQLGVAFGTNSDIFKNFNKEVASGSRQITSVTKSINQASASGTKFTGVISSLYGGLRKLAYLIPGFGIAGIVALLLTPLQALGKELVSYVRKASGVKNATEDLAKQFKESNKIIGESGNEYTRASSLVNELTINIDLAKRGFLDKNKVLKQYNESIGKTTGEVKSLDQAEQDLVKNGDAYIKMTLYKAAAQLALEEAAKSAFEAEKIRRQKNEEFANSLTDFKVVNSGQSFNAADFEADEARRRTAEAKRKVAAIKEKEDEEKEKVNIAKRFQQQAADIAKNFDFNLFGDDDKTRKSADKLKAITGKFFTDSLQDQAAFLRKQAENELYSYNQRVQFLKDAAEIEKEILAGSHDVEVNNEREKLNAVLAQANVSAIAKQNAQNEFAERSKEIEQKYANDILRINTKLNDDIWKVGNEVYKKRLADQEAFKKQEADWGKQLLDQQKNSESASIKSLEDATESRINELNRGKDILFKSLQEEQNAEINAAKGPSERQKIEEKYNQKRLAVELETNKFILLAQLDLAKERLKLLKDPNEKAAFEAKIADIKNQLEKLKGVKIDFNIKSGLDKLRQLADAIEEAAGKFTSVMDVIGGAVQASVDSQKNSVQEQIDLLDQRTKAEIDAVTASQESEEKKAAQIAIINARAQAQKDQYEKRQQEIDLQKARFNKDNSIAQIILNTAVAVSKFLSEGKVSEAFFAGSLGAAQLAVAIASPLPHYKEGTGFHPGGAAVTGDGGVHEYVKTEGKIYETPDFPTVMNIPHGAIVYPNERAMLEANVGGDINTLPKLVDHGRYYKEMTSAIGGKLDRIERAIRNKAEVHFTRNRDGWTRLSSRGASRSKYLNDNL